MTRLERREHALRRLEQIRLNKIGPGYHADSSGRKRRKVVQLSPEKVESTAKSHPSIPFTLSEPLPYTPPEYHHHISQSRNFPIHIHNFLDSTRVDDPAITVCLIIQLNGDY
jgi:hypothetical protein